MYPQLPLDISPRQSDSFDEFWVGENRLPVSLCQAMAQGAEERQVFLWGSHGSGKTHLLNAACRLAREQGQEAILVTGEAIKGPEFRGDPFEALEQYALVCIDDVQVAAGRSLLERGLFNLINRARQTPNCRLLFAADENPNSMALGLADLRSRLIWGPVLKLSPVTDEDLPSWLMQRAEHMGMHLPTQVANYMANRYPRVMPDLLDKLEQLNRESIAAQRTLTVRFVKIVLEGATYGQSPD